MLLLPSTPLCLSDHGGLYPLKLSPDNSPALKVILSVMKKVSDASIEFRLFSVPM